jgi:hypothetical protein
MKDREDRIDSSDTENSSDRKQTELSESAALSRTKELVQRHKVCWEAYPEQALLSSEIRKIGFSLELYGTHEPGVDHVSPGCEHCTNVKSALKEIAQWILPREKRESLYQVEIENQTLSYAQERGDRPDVRATVRIVHRHGWEQPIDECEVRCLKEMKQSLCEIGACKGAWRDERNEMLLRRTGAVYGP